jgi:hypothetical protein
MGITGAHLGENLAFKGTPAELCSKAPPWANLGGAICYQTCFPFTVCRTDARTKIEFSFLNCNLMVPAARPHTFWS